MKFAIAILAMLVLSMASVLAANPTGFSYTNIGQAAGDWKYVGSSWSYGNFPTAQVTATGNSPLATLGTLGKVETMGQPWKYALSLQATANAPTTYANLVHVETVNDPVTTPATGGYTKFGYSEMSAGVFGGSTLAVNGYGWADISSVVVVDSASQQSIEAGINQ